MVRRPEANGFTLLELVTVLGIMGILFGLTIGAFRRSVPRRELARNQLIDALRRARLFALSEQSPAMVTIVDPALTTPGSLEPGSGEGWPVIRTVGRRVVGTWHLEGEDRSGFPGECTATEVESVEQGVLGHALHLSGDAPSEIDFGTYSSFESVDGIAAEMFVNLDDLRARVLLTKGRAFRWSLDSDGGMSLRVSVLVPSAEHQNQWVEAFEELRTDRPVVAQQRWIRLAAAFDGMSLRLLADDLLVAETYLKRPARLVIDHESDLILGGEQQPFSGSVDEVKYGVFVAEVSEPLVSMRVAGTVQRVRFAAGGGLDPMFHSIPASIVMKTESGADLSVTVSLLGVVE